MEISLFSRISESAFLNRFVAVSVKIQFIA